MPTIDITEHLPLVYWSVKRCKVAYWASLGACTGHEDAVQAGRMGLMRAAEKFDESRGIKFATYARWWIDAYIKDYCFEQLRTVRIPRNRQMRMWKKGIPVPTHATSIDTGFAVNDRDDGSSILDYLGFHAHQEDEQPDTDHLHSRLKSALRGLPAREAAVLHGRFYENRTLAELGEELGVSRERIRQLQLKALAKLKQHFDVAS
jgi:RNA polymerase sigma factor (sigma-70 family)